MKNMTRWTGIILTLALIVMMAGCQQEPRELILSTTTSTENSGLLDAIIPDFEEQTGIDVKVVAVGTGAALQMGRDGEADVLLVHAKPDELIFVEEGHGTVRYDVMYNDFVIVGPAEDPAGIAGNSLDEAFGKLSEAVFVSRGDNSGTNKKELLIWESLALTPGGEGYVSSGQGMGDTLAMASEMKAYTLTDRATYLSMMDDLELEILNEGDERLFNQYGVIPVNPEKNDLINADEAEAFVEWLLSEETQAMIGTFGVDTFGQSLFYPNAK